MVNTWLYSQHIQDTYFAINLLKCSLYILIFLCTFILKMRCIETCTYWKIGIDKFKIYKRRGITIKFVSPSHAYSSQHIKYLWLWLEKAKSKFPCKIPDIYIWHWNKRYAVETTMFRHIATPELEAVLERDYIRTSVCDFKKPLHYYTTWPSTETLLHLIYWRIQIIIPLFIFEMTNHFSIS